MARYFPVDLDINDDGELWELTELYGGGALRVWLEVLSILEKKRNRWKMTEQGWRSIFNKCHIHSGTGFKIVRKLFETGWIMVLKPVSNEFQTSLKSVSNQFQIEIGSPNYWKYHTRQCTQSDFTWEINVSLLTYPNLTFASSHKNAQKRGEDPASPAPSADSFDVQKNGRGNMGRSMNLIPELKRETDRLYESDRVKFKRLAAWVAEGRKHEILETDMAAALRQFWDYRMVDDWYPYLDSILEKIVRERTVAVFDQEHLRRKAEEARPLQGSVLSLVKSLADAKKV
jgi:hypothetical protein